YGDITINAGDSAAGSSWAGWFLMWGYNRAENYGDISMKGGNSSADNTTVYSSDYGLGIFSDLGPAINTGDVDMSGGLASGANSTGGKGSIFELVGYSAMNSGAITVKGGNSTGTDGVGGAANDIFIYGVFEGSTNTGTFNIDAGTGATLGAHGEVVIDGMNMTDSWYTP
ncbi:hypothetical protein KAI87_12765, partial [Myxococcota bacterium]|nr:hypothetical protein [Myxococcota bacterium]